MSDRKLILYISCSLDGYLATENDDLSFLSKVQVEGEDYGYTAFTDSVDTVIVGRKTYDWVMEQVPEFPHANKESYIITRTPRPQEGNIHFYTGDLAELVNTLKQREGKNIYCDGGAQVVSAMLQHRLFDELIISVIPVLLGAGKRLFTDGRPRQDLELIASTPYQSGLVQLHYKTL